MIEILKPHEEQNPTEQEPAKLCENLEESQKEENTNKEINTQVIVETPDEEILFTLQTLGDEERELLTEKSQLQNLEEILKQKILGEIEEKRHRIENLKHEIPELKQRCEFLAKVLNIPVQK